MSFVFDHRSSDLTPFFGPLLMKVSRASRESWTCVAAGEREVGARICLSPRTVKYHMAETMCKLHLKNRAQVLTYLGRTASDTRSQEPTS